MIELIEENRIEKNNFLESLNYQISKKDPFFRKIPEFQKQLEEIDFRIGLKESALKIKKGFEDLQRRSSYGVIIKELNDLIKKHNANK